MVRIILVATLVLLSSTAYGREISGVQVEERISGTDGVTLTLNGAGIRSKFVFEIYIAELYLENPSSSVEEVIKNDGQKRMVLHFLYSEVDKESLVDAWNEGFEGNLSEEKHATLKDDIDAFNQMFDLVKEGDQVILDYTPTTGTTVTVKGVVKGVIPGKEFNDALLSIWLGKKPVTKKLRNNLLDYKKG